MGETGVTGATGAIGPCGPLARQKAKPLPPVVLVYDPQRQVVPPRAQVSFRAQKRLLVAIRKQNLLGMQAAITDGGAHVNGYCGPSMLLPIQEAVFRGRCKAAKLLIDNGAIVCFEPPTIYSLLLAPMRHKDYDMLALLLEAGCPQFDRIIWTCPNDVRVLKLLCKHGSVLTDEWIGWFFQKSDAATVAASAIDVEFIRWVVAQAPTSVFAQSALLFATSKRVPLDIVGTLLKKRAPITMEVVRHAFYYGSESLVHRLLDHWCVFGNASSVHCCLFHACRLWPWNAIIGAAAHGRIVAHVVALDLCSPNAPLSCAKTHWREKLTNSNPYVEKPVEQFYELCKQASQIDRNVDQYRRRIDWLRLLEPLANMAIALAPLDLPALLSVELIDALFCNNMVTMHLKWQLVVAVKNKFNAR